MWNVMCSGRAVVRRFRRGLYWPLDWLSGLPGGALHWMWLVRLVIRLDAPLRRYLLEGANHAKSTG